MRKLFFLLLISFQSFAQIDPLEFPPGHPNVTIDAITQLQSFPVPRFKPGHTLLPNYNVMDPIYFGGYKQPGVSDAMAIKTQADIQRQLARDYNYMLNLTWFNGAYNDTCVKMANDNPQWKCCIMSLRAQTGGTKMWDQNFPNDHYLQNSSGTFLDWSGQATAYPYKVWRPGAPVADYATDGDVVRGAFNTSLSKLNRDISICNEDGEVYPILENIALQSDPFVVAGKNASGLGWQPYLAKKVRENDNAYRSKFMSHPRLLNAKYTEYRMDGHRDYQLAWEEARFINDPINGQYYATPDLYVRWPYNWKDWVSAWHGLRWISEGRHYELAVNDKLFSPFVAAGWSSNSEEDVRPAQWLGLMKIMGMYGAEFYYTSYFTESLPANDPKGYAWQAVIPPYSQAISSRYEDILRNGNLLAGDMINNQHYAYGINTPIPFYQFSTGKTNYVVVVRKHNTLNKYAITGTIQNSSNIPGSAPLVDDCQINLNGQILKFKIRRQGSTYVYDNSVTPAVFYQLDGWHQYEHPWYWTKDFEGEGENFDASTGVIKTYAAAGTDFRSFQTVLSLSNNQTASYSFTVREAGIKYLFVKAIGTSSYEATFDANKQTSNISNGWNRISLGNVSNGSHQLLLKALGTLEIDSISVTSNPNKYSVTTCVPPSAVISPSKPNPVCNSDTVLLSASPGVSWEWSSGQTTQTISVFNSATYDVHVSNGQCSAVSTPYTVQYITCTTCPAPDGLYITNVGKNGFKVHWNRVSTADNGYTVNVRDVTASVDLNPYKKKKNTDTNPQIFIGEIIGDPQHPKLIPGHKYNVNVISNCKDMNSALSATVTVTTKGGSTGKWAMR